VDTPGGVSTPDVFLLSKAQVYPVNQNRDCFVSLRLGGHLFSLLYSNQSIILITGHLIQT
jgi:hypothetical protein